MQVTVELRDRVRRVERAPRPRLRVDAVLGPADCIGDASLHRGNGARLRNDALLRLVGAAAGRSVGCAANDASFCGSALQLFARWNDDLLGPAFDAEGAEVAASGGAASTTFNFWGRARGRRWSRLFVCNAQGWGGCLRDRRRSTAQRRQPPWEYAKARGRGRACMCSDERQADPLLGARQRAASGCRD
jgi:hypothetical protein